MKELLCLILLLPMLAANAAGSATSSYSQKALFKNWSLSRCIAKAYPNGPIVDDAEITAAAYLELSDVPIEAFDEVKRLVDKYLARPYDGSVKSPYHTMKCIDLFYGKELDALWRKYAKGVTEKRR